MLRKRPYILPEWCERAIAEPLRREEQADGRLRSWWRVEALSEHKPRHLRVVTLADVEIVHDAFLDRNFDEAAS